MKRAFWPTSLTKPQGVRRPVLWLLLLFLGGCHPFSCLHPPDFPLDIPEEIESMVLEKTIRHFLLRENPYSGGLGSLQSWVTTKCRNVGQYEYISNGDPTLFRQLGNRDTLWDCELALEENAYGTLGNFIEGKWEGPRRGSSTSQFHSIWLKDLRR